MSWDYRVIGKRNEASHARHYAVYEVYYDEQHRIWACTEEPVFAEGETIEGLKQELLDHLQACALPPLNYEDIPEDGALDPVAEDNRSLPAGEWGLDPATGTWHLL